MKIFKILFFAVVAWYVSLCAANYLAQRPLWNDEYWVCESVLKFSPAEMFGKTLVQDQTFPRLYLFAIQQVAKPFHFHLLSLRFLSFICMLMAFGLWLSIARRALPDDKEYLTFLLSWPASVLMVYYSAELKQYSMDVMAAAVFIWFIYNQQRWQKESPRKFLIALTALPFLLLCSYPAYFFLMIPAWNIFLSRREDPRAWRYLAGYAFSVVVFGSLSYAFDIRWRPAYTNTVSYGDHFISFASVPEFLRTFGDGVSDLFSRWYGERPKTVRKVGWFFVGWGLLYLFYGFFKNIRKEKFYLRTLDTMAFVIFAESFILGALKKYPFSVPRTSLFFCPIVFYLIVKGIGSLKTIHPWVSKSIHLLYAAFLIFMALCISRVFYSGDPSFAPVLWGKG